MAYQQVGGSDDIESAKNMGGLALGAAAGFAASHKDEAYAYASEKVSDLRKMVEEGDGSWKYLGFVAGALIMFISFMGFLSSLFSFAPVLCVVYMYFFCAGALMAALEFKDAFIPSSYREIIRREALFLYRPYGRAGFYFGVGLILICLGGVLTPLVGIYTAAVGVYIHYGSSAAVKALSQLRAESHNMESVRAMFDKADTEKNGSLDAAELATVCASLGTTLNKNQLETALFILDKNSDGVITFDEFFTWWKEGENN